MGTQQVPLTVVVRIQDISGGSRGTSIYFAPFAVAVCLVFVDYGGDFLFALGFGFLFQPDCMDSTLGNLLVIFLTIAHRPRLLTGIWIKI